MLERMAGYYLPMARARGRFCAFDRGTGAGLRARAPRSSSPCRFVFERVYVCANRSGIAAETRAVQGP
jgi:hypothetical protein